MSWHITYDKMNSGDMQEGILQQRMFLCFVQIPPPQFQTFCGKEDKTTRNKT
jgi:hypothetical protein